MYAIRSYYVFTSLLIFELIFNFQNGASQILDQRSVADSTKEATVVEPIPLSNIGVQTEATLNTIREIRNRIKSNSS